MSLDRIGLLRRHHRCALPLLAPAFSHHRVDADVVLCSTSGWAHGVATAGGKIVYCHSPARWLYQSDRYLRTSGPWVGRSLQLLREPLLRWDQRSARSARRYLTNSAVVQRRVREAYGIEAEVLFPPHSIDVAGTQKEVNGVEPGAVLAVSRLLAYKNVDAVVGAFAELPEERLVVVGVGPERERLQSAATANVRFVGMVDDAELRWLYASCGGIASASHEDYGLTPLEAAAFGKPAAVLRWGGYEETVVEGQTGVFFDVATPAAVTEGIRRLRRHPWDPGALQAHAARFSEASFIARLRRIVADESSVGE